MTLKSRVIALFMLIAVTGAAAPLAAAQGTFTDDQKAEIGRIVREYLLQNPQLLQEIFGELEKRANEEQARQAQSAIAQHAAELFRSPSDLVAGNPQGDVTMVEFFDYNCPYCKKSMADVAKLIDTDKDLKVVLKEWPILGPDSVFAATAALASRQQGKYREFHQALLGATGRVDQARVLSIAEDVGLDVARLQKDMNAPAIKGAIERTAKIAEALGIRGTPAFIIGEDLIPGAVGFDALARAISTVREAGGCKVC